MIDPPDTASVATCAAIAQILPVFMVALVAERIVLAKRPKTPTAKARSVLASLLRIAVDTVIATCLLAFTLRALMGIEANGLRGSDASELWIATFVLGFAILYRWMLLSTPMLQLVSEFGQIVADFIFDGIARLAEILPAWLAGAWTFLYNALYFVSEVAFSVITAGLYDGALRTAERAVSRFVRKDDSAPSRGKDKSH